MFEFDEFEWDMDVLGFDWSISMDELNDQINKNLAEMEAALNQPIEFDIKEFYFERL